MNNSRSTGLQVSSGPQYNHSRHVPRARDSKAPVTRGVSGEWWSWPLSCYDHGKFQTDWRTRTVSVSHS